MGPGGTSMYLVSCLQMGGSLPGTGGTCIPCPLISPIRILIYPWSRPISARSQLLSFSMEMVWLSLFLYHHSLSRANNLAIFSYMYPSLVAVAFSRSLTRACRVSTCNIKRASEARRVPAIPPNILPPLTGQSLMMGLVDDSENQVA